MLDTDTIVALLRNQPSAAREKFLRVVDGGEALTNSAITFFELSYGIAESGRAKINAERLNVLLASGIEILAFSEVAASIAGEIRAELEAVGRRIGGYDLLIAGHARQTGSTLVTGNVREFGRLRDLRVENWLAGASSQSTCPHVYFMLRWPLGPRPRASIIDGQVPSGMRLTPREWPTFTDAGRPAPPNLPPAPVARRLTPPPRSSAAPPARAPR